MRRAAYRCLANSTEMVSAPDEGIQLNAMLHRNLHDRVGLQVMMGLMAIERARATKHLEISSNATWTRPNTAACSASAS